MEAATAAPVLPPVVKIHILVSAMLGRTINFFQKPLPPKSSIVELAKKTAPELPTKSTSSTSSSMVKINLLLSAML